MRETRLTLPALLVLLAPAAVGQTGPAAGPGHSQAAQPALDGPAIRSPRLSQAEVEDGALTLKELRRHGLEMFTTPFNRYDGHGDGPSGSEPSTPGQRPTTNGSWLRLNGLDSQSCQECHAFASMATVPPRPAIGGVAGIASTAFPGLTELDVADLDLSGVAEVNGRMINPPFLFGAGGVELLGKEMTADLQSLKTLAQAAPGTEVHLVTKGVSFGTLSYDEESGFDASGVEGVDDDLVVRPFGRKGEFSTVRAFTVGALQFHMGMQPVERVGSGADADEDGVVDEVLVGEVSAIHVFGVTLERPAQVGANQPTVRRGEDVFWGAGCASCHTPLLETASRWLDLAFPEVETDPSANVYYSIDLAARAPGFQRARTGGVLVPLHSDLKRHDMGPDLAETTGSALDPLYVTPRLWGISDTAPYLHDGRAMTLAEAILAHGGEGRFAAEAFAGLSPAERDDLLTYLDSLRSPADPAHGIDEPRRDR